MGAIQWAVTPDKRVDGFDSSARSGMSAEGCKEACITETEFTCLHTELGVFEHTGECYLSDKSMATAKTSAAPGIYIYGRIDIQWGPRGKYYLQNIILPLQIIES